MEGVSVGLNLIRHFVLSLSNLYEDTLSVFTDLFRDCVLSKALLTEVVKHQEESAHLVNEILVHEYLPELFLIKWCSLRSSSMSSDLGSLDREMKRVLEHGPSLR